VVALVALAVGIKGGPYGARDLAQGR
jgi:hypothetical protein